MLFSKRGQSNAPWITALSIIGALAVIIFIASIFVDFDFSNGFNSAEVSFENIFNARGFFILDYVFGKVPQYLIDATNNVSAAIVLIGIWTVFLLAFGDILSIFAFFNKGVSWVAAIVLTVIVSNLKLVFAASVLAFTFTAIFGALSVVASLGMAFALFVAFHFGTSTIRRWVILRRAEDHAMRAVAGGRRIASGASVLADVARQAEEAEGRGRGYGTR